MKARFVSKYSHKEVEIEIPTEVLIAAAEFIGKTDGLAEVVIPVDGLYRVCLYRWWDSNPLVIIRDIRSPYIIYENSLRILLGGGWHEFKCQAYRGKPDKLVRSPSLVKKRILETKVKLAFLLFDLHLVKSFKVQDQRLKVVWRKKRR